LTCRGDPSIEPETKGKRGKVVKMKGGGEPTVRVGIMEGRREVRGYLEGSFTLGGSTWRETGFVAAATPDGGVRLSSPGGLTAAGRDRLRLQGSPGSLFCLEDVTIGISFHWERRRRQTYAGDLVLEGTPEGCLRVINEIPLETYLESVVASEMREKAPKEFLKAHAVASRSWLLALLRRREGCDLGAGDDGRRETGDEIVRWYGREDHEGYDVCADDHCQRYQGVGHVTGEGANAAVRETRGLVLLHGGEVCDARYHKACGGITEDFANVWEPRHVPYLTSVSDGEADFPPRRGEEEARAWILADPPAFCRLRDQALLGEILPDYDCETADFFRWRVVYDRRRLEGIIEEKSGLSFGRLRDLVPLERGPSGRIIRLRIEGSERTVVVGKELEIRRWLSESHLLSSAFVVAREGGKGAPDRFVLYGAGWGHGVGMCQVGAAAMAVRGYTCEAILRHYFPGATPAVIYP